MITTETIQAYINNPLNNPLSRSEIMELMRELVTNRDAQGKAVAWEVKGILCNTLEEAQVYIGEPEPLYAVPPTDSTALQNFKDAMQGIGHIQRTLNETFGGLHGTHVEPDVIKECKAICDAIHAAYVRTVKPVSDLSFIDHVNQQFESLHAKRLPD